MKWSAVLVLIACGSSVLAQDAKPTEQAGKPGEKAVEKQPQKPAEEATRRTEGLPSAESLFEKHIAAIGGMDAIKAEKNRFVRAKYQGPGNMGDGMLRVLRVPPSKMYQTLEIPGQLTQEVWCNAEEGWMRDTNNGTHRLQGDALVEFKRQADYYGEANYKIRYKEIKTVAAEKFNDVDVYAVRAVPGEGKERTLYFDAKSGLMIGMKIPGAPGTDNDSVTVFKDYKKFGEVMQPTVFVSTTRSSQSTITILDIRTDLATMPSADPPDEVRNVK